MTLKTMSSAKSTGGEEKNTAAMATMGGVSVSRSAAAASSSLSPSSCAASSSDEAPTRSSCCCLTKLAVKLKKWNKMLLRHNNKNRQSSFQCLYDPLSYSLNFDGSGKGSVLNQEDEDYYRFYAFSSRFVMANSRSIAANPRQIAISH
ncbi:uncharacterized protein LOC104429803 [Eucalyptus grandis]|uniref:uncharacterized protein LOC104429803 n=1 Tax=Eucalyptus grandis TaxID=71139 RepID=UPI00192E8089|nr:uncharacterized protein LOC104429803 [Eucalyptus grandis]